MLAFLLNSFARPTKETESKRVNKELVSFTYAYVFLSALFVGRSDSPCLELSTVDLCSCPLQANIRAKIQKKKLDGYLRKKYIAKLMYMFILGYEVDFGCNYSSNYFPSILLFNFLFFPIPSDRGGKHVVL